MNKTAFVLFLVTVPVLSLLLSVWCFASRWKTNSLFFADTCVPGLWRTVVFWSIVMNRWKTGNNLSSQRCIAIHNQSCTYKTYLDYNTFCCAITQLLIIKGEHHRENLITISLAPTNITMGKVSSLNVTGNVHWKLFWLIIWISYFIVDHILRRQKFPGSASWVHERLRWPSPLLQPLQLNPSGEWLFCGLWEIPLPGPPVLLAQGGVLWQPAHDWYQWLHPILPYDSSGESDMEKKAS